MFLKRRQLFEWNDLPWIPDSFRSFLTDFLNYILICRQPFLPAVYLLLRALRYSKSDTIVDLCSGQGGPWPKLLPLMQNKYKSAKQLKVTLTDKYPASSRYNQIHWHPSLRYYPQSVDATAIPSSLTGMRTIFNGFHHFNEQEAKKILRNSVEQDQVIVIFEMLQRNWIHVLLSFLMPLVVLVVTPRIRPFRWHRLIFTYIIPIAPLLIFWDTLISTLRCYHPDEFMQLATSVDDVKFQWESGSYNYRGIAVSYFLGYPKQSRSDEQRLDREQ